MFVSRIVNYLVELNLPSKGWDIGIGLLVRPRLGIMTKKCSKSILVLLEPLTWYEYLPALETVSFQVPGRGWLISYIAALDKEIFPEVTEYPLGFLRVIVGFILSVATEIIIFSVESSIGIVYVCLGRLLFFFPLVLPVSPFSRHVAPASAPAVTPDSFLSSLAFGSFNSWPHVSFAISSNGS